jgi:hypothetical protein
MSNVVAVLTRTAAFEEKFRLEDGICGPSPGPLTRSYYITLRTTAGDVYRLYTWAQILRNKQKQSAAYQALLLGAAQPT